MTVPHFGKRIDQMLTSQGDGTGTIDQNIAGKTITGATTAEPVVCTSVAHGYSDGDWLFIDGMTGITECNGVRQVTNKAADTFELLDEDGAAVDSAGTFGGTVDSNLAFVIKPPTGEKYTLERLLASAGDASAWVVGGMLGVAALTNGIFVKAYSGEDSVWYQLNSTPIKGWSDWVFCAGVDAGTIADVTNNKYEMGVRWTFSKNAAGPITLNGTNGDFIAMYSQDDLDGLSFLKAGVQGFSD